MVTGIWVGLQLTRSVKEKKKNREVKIFMGLIKFQRFDGAFWERLKIGYKLCDVI